MSETKKKPLDLFHEWDVITLSEDGQVIWRRYGDGLILMARRGEMPDAALERHLEREREERERQHALPFLPPTHGAN